MAVIDSIAPVKTKVLSGRKKSPWRNATLVKAKKRLCRQAERKWRINRLQVCYDIYKESLHKYNLDINRTEAYKTVILLRHYHQKL